MNPENMNRKLFLKLTLTGVATGVLSACSGDDPASSGPTGTGTVGTSGTTGSGTTSTTGGNTVTTTTGSSTVTGSTTGTTSTTGASGTTGTTGATGTTSTTGATGTTGTGTATGSGTGTGTTNSGAGGTGNTAMCSAVTLTHVSTDATMGVHDHLPLSAAEEMQFVMRINGETTEPLEWAGGDDHSHTIVFTADEITTLATGGTLSNRSTDNDPYHSHVYDISCA